MSTLTTGTETESNIDTEERDTGAWTVQGTNNIHKLRIKYKDCDVDMYLWQSLSDITFEFKFDVQPCFIEYEFI